MKPEQNRNARGAKRSSFVNKPENIAPELRISPNSSNPEEHDHSKAQLPANLHCWWLPRPLPPSPPPPPIAAAAAAPAGDPPPPEGGLRVTAPSGDSDRGGWTTNGFLAAFVRRPTSGEETPPSSRGAVGARSSLGHSDRGRLDCLRVLRGRSRMS